MSNTIAFIGLGHMGKPMALNLLKAGHSLKVFDLNADAMKELQAAGAQVGESAVQIAKDAQMVFTMLPAGRHVRQVYEGENGVLQPVALDALHGDKGEAWFDLPRVQADAGNGHVRHLVQPSFE